jgi:hypothetical protein
MSNLPIPYWVSVTRKTILLVGSAWPVVVFAMSLGQGSFDPFALVGALFLGVVFVPPSLILGAVIPTYKSRILMVPPVLLGIYWWLSSTSSSYSGFGIHPHMLMWITTFTAIGLLVPQYFARRRAEPGA